MGRVSVVKLVHAFKNKVLVGVTRGLWGRAANTTILENINLVGLSVVYTKLAESSD